MNAKLKNAIAAIHEMSTKINETEADARKLLMDILEPCGQFGVSVAPCDMLEDDIYYPMVEISPRQFRVITLVRYYKGRLEVFLSKEEDLTEGEWCDYMECEPDTHLILDQLLYNLEYADGYEEEFEVDDDMLFVSKKIFGDDKEHNIELEFRDGIAFGIGNYEKFFVTYPMRKDLTDEMKREMDEFQGVYDRTEYTYRDICLKYGTLQRR